MTNPSSVFGKQITESSKGFVVSIVKCILLRFLFDAYNDEHININDGYSWFSQTQPLLSQQLDLIKLEKIRYHDQYIGQDDINTEKDNYSALQFFRGPIGDRFDTAKKITTGIGYLSFITGNWRMISEVFNLDLHPYLELVIVTSFCYGIAFGIPSKIREYSSAVLHKITFYELSKPSLIQNKNLYVDLSNKDNSKFFFIDKSEIDELKTNMKVLNGI